MAESVKTTTLHNHRRVEVLLNTLRAERHLRRPLLLEALDSLAALEERDDALDAARDLLGRLDFGMDEGEYERSIERISDLAFQPVGENEVGLVRLQSRLDKSPSLAR